MPSKYDTNPLDPDFPEKARAAAAASEGEQETQVLPQGMAPTTQFGPAPVTEEQTRRFDAAPFANPYTGQSVPMGYQNPYIQPMQPRKLKIGGTSVSENILIAAPYVPWYIGLVAGALILLLTPKSETKVRFHAAQGLAAHVGILIVTTILGILSNVTGVAAVGNMIFQIVMTIMLVVWTIKAYKGRPVHIGAIEDLTNWLDDKIEPKLIGK